MNLTECYECPFGTYSDDVVPTPPTGGIFDTTFDTTFE